MMWMCNSRNRPPGDHPLP